jgi:ribosome maturation factor RimP
MLGKYRLEVSSPGTDRPLKTISDFRRNIGRCISGNDVEGNTIEGCIKRVDDSNLYLENKGNEIKISISSIKFAKLLITFRG